jgi:hypothetical protein
LGFTRGRIIGGGASVLAVGVAWVATAGGHPEARRRLPLLTGSPNVCVPDVGGSEGWCGDGGPAIAARLFSPEGVAALHGGGFLIADSKNNVVRAVSSAGVISTVAGTGFIGAGHAHGLADQVPLNNPSGVAVLAGGGYLIADTGNHVVREVRPNGRIATIAGTGVAGSTGDGGPAVRAALRSPQGVAVSANGSIVIADPAANRVREILPNGRMETLAGTGAPGFGGDGGPAKAAELDYPTGVATEADGTVLIADDGNYRIRSVAPNGIISTAAGGVDGTETPGTPTTTTTTTPSGTTTTTTTSGAGTTGTGTTGGGVSSATQLQLNGPTGVAATPTGGFVIADGPVVELVSPSGGAQVIAGTGKPDNTAPSGPATSTPLGDATAVSVSSEGPILIADDHTNRVREVAPGGQLITVAGAGSPEQLISVGSRACPNPDPRAQWYGMSLVPTTGGISSATGRPIVVTFTTSLKAGIVVTVSHRGQMVASSRGTYNPTTHKTTLGRPHAPGSYDLKVSGTTTLNGHVIRNCAESDLNVVVPRRH